MTSVELKNIAQSFSGRAVLRDVSVSIDSGDYVVLLGKSGCGKTTLLRTIAGLQPPEAGDVLFDGVSIVTVDPRHRDVSLVSQHDGLYPHRTVRQSMQLPLNGRFKADDVQQRIENAIRLTRIEPIVDRYPDRLSGGELRRAAIAKAVARAGLVRLLDEPLTALDVPLRQSLQDDLLRWHREVPGTTIHVTHDGQEAIRMADKIAVIENGQIVQFATPDQIYRDPATVSVAQSIGSPAINLFHCEIRDGIVRTNTPSFNYAVADGDTLPEGELLIGIRPEAFTVSSSEGKVAFAGEVQRVDPIQGMLHVTAANGDAIVHAILAQSLVEEGETIRLVANVGQTLQFNAMTGKRVK